MGTNYRVHLHDCALNHTFNIILLLLTFFFYSISSSRASTTSPPQLSKKLKKFKTIRKILRLESLGKLHSFPYGKFWGSCEFDFNSFTCGYFITLLFAITWQAAASSGVFFPLLFAF